VAGAVRKTWRKKKSEKMGMHDAGVTDAQALQYNFGSTGRLLGGGPR